MSFFRQAARAALEIRAADGRLPWGDSTPPSPSYVGSNASGIPVTQTSASGISAVYGCCSLLADSVASLPLELRTGPDRKSSTPLPLTPLLKHPYAEISRRDWWVGFVWALALRGNFYGQVIERDDLELPVQIRPIHNDFVQVWRDRGSGQLVYRYYGVEIPLKDVFHIRYQLPPGEVIGLNPIKLLGMTFGNAIAKERFVESFYLNSANPMGVIEVPTYLDRTETRKMMRSWLSAHQGLNKANLPAILTDNATFKPITISPLDSQLLQALEFTDAQICGRVFRVPPHLVGIPERVSGTKGIEQQERSFFANTLVGYLDIGREALTSVSRPGAFVHFNTTSRERGATLERAQAAALGMNSGIFVADETREWFDLPPLPNGDGAHSYMPINTQLLATAIEVLKQTKAMPLPTANGNAPSTVSGAQPRPGTPPSPSGNPTRKPSPNGAVNRPRSDGGNGHMTPEDAWHIVQSAVDQAERMQAAADYAERLGFGEGE